MGVAVLQILALIISEQANAQITPDNTLGAESSVVTSNVEIQGLPSDAQGQELKVLRIDGGAIRGINLFHSFQEFNIGEGGGVYFSNPQGIENILSRVTGTNHSEILGRLGVLGNANLFLINPNGIIFGAHASWGESSERDPSRHAVSETLATKGFQK
jgi:filamentous hemagglutinin family protein